MRHFIHNSVGHRRNIPEDLDAVLCLAFDFFEFYLQILKRTFQPVSNFFFRLFMLIAGYYLPEPQGEHCAESLCGYLNDTLVVEQASLHSVLVSILKDFAVTIMHNGGQPHAGYSIYAVPGYADIAEILLPTRRRYTIKVPALTVWRALPGFTRFHTSGLLSFNYPETAGSFRIVSLSMIAGT